jgi:hypothetical protein
MIRRLRELERRKKKKRMVTVDEKGLIAVDGFEVARETWSSLIQLIASQCELLLSSLLIGDDWRVILEPSTLLSVGTDFSFAFARQDGSQTSPEFSLRHPIDYTQMDQLCSYFEVAFHGLGLRSLRYIELKRREISRCIWHRSTIYYDAFCEKVYSHKTKAKNPFANSIEHKLPQSIARLFLIYRQLVAPLEAFGSEFTVPKRKDSKHSMCHAVAEMFGFVDVPDAVQVRHFWTSILNYLFPGGDLSGAL